MRGGAREGAGKPKGAKHRRTELKEWAEATGDLPHVFLCKVSQGQTFEMTVLVNGVEEKKVLCPSMKDRITAAIAAAPFFAPRLAQIEQKIESEMIGVIRAEPMSVEEWVAEFADQNQNSLGTTSGAPEGFNKLPSE